MQPRHQARIVAIQALFEVDLTGHEPSMVLQQRLAEGEMATSGIPFAIKLVMGVQSTLAHIDGIIQEIAPDWPIDQVAPIDRNILRLAIYEIMTAETPVKVIINEAVELAKLFGSDSSHRFINGVLGTLVRNRDKYKLPGQE